MSYFRIEDCILYEDPHILVCRKPSGIAVQNGRVGSMDMECAIKNYLAEREPGKMPYVGIVHRLDQPVEGVLVFARTPEAAGELCRQMARGEFGKKYLAVTFARPEKNRGILEDYLIKDGKGNYSRVVPKNTPGSKRARLSYEVIRELPGKNRRDYGSAVESSEKFTGNTQIQGESKQSVESSGEYTGNTRIHGESKQLVESSGKFTTGNIQMRGEPKQSDGAPGDFSSAPRYLLAVKLETGRHHQIRVQLSHAGMPLVGDKKYNPEDSSGMPLGLCSVELCFVHPATKKKMKFQVEPAGEAF